MTGPSPFSVAFDQPARAGWRFSCKEMFDVAGHPATCGHPSYAAFRGDRPTSAVVARLQAAGAGLVGKTLQSELAMSGTGENPHFPMPANPAGAGLVTGGSSAGCAVAVATAAVDLAVATDSAGSARIPAACCGVLGMALAGQDAWLADSVRLSPTLDQLGLLAAGEQELARALQVLGIGATAEAPARVLVPRRLVDTHCDAAARRSFREAVALLRGRGLEVETTEAECFHEADDLQRRHGTLVLAEMAASLAGFLERHEGEVSPAIVERLRPYLGLSAAWRRDLAALVLAPLRRFRAQQGAPLLLPTLPVAVPPRGAAASLGSLTKFANLLGESSVSLRVPGAGTSVTLVAAAPASLLGFARWAAGER